MFGPAFFVHPVHEIWKLAENIKEEEARLEYEEGQVYTVGALICLFDHIKRNLKSHAGAGKD
jgi:hypothetical protein